MSNIYKRYPPNKVINMASFQLRAIPFPTSANDVLFHLEKYYQKIPIRIIEEEIEYVKQDKNVHVLLTLNTRVNYRRSDAISQCKRIICMEHYKEVFKRDRLYVY